MSDTRSCGKHFLHVVPVFWFSIDNSPIVKYKGVKLHRTTKSGYYMFASDLTIFEISFGVYYGFRLGINFDELLDFLFGIFGFDFKGDYGAKYFTFCIDYSKSTEKELETRTKILDRIRTNTTSENTK